jgi:hypothetical protein
MRIRAEADAAGGDDDARDERVRIGLAAARDEHVHAWTLAAAKSLLCDPIQYTSYEDGHRFYVNGRHRSQAMLDAGVRRTLVVHWDWPAAAGDAR